MYPDSKWVWYFLRPFHPKFIAIKDEVQKVFIVGFFYPISLTEWVSNIIPVMKKQGIIRVCVCVSIIDSYTMPVLRTIILPRSSTKFFMIVLEVKFFI